MREGSRGSPSTAGALSPRPPRVATTRDILGQAVLRGIYFVSQCSVQLGPEWKLESPSCSRSQVSSPTNVQQVTNIPPSPPFLFPRHSLKKRVREIFFRQQVLCSWSTEANLRLDTFKSKACPPFHFVPFTGMGSQRTAPSPYRVAVLRIKVTLIREKCLLEGLNNLDGLQKFLLFACAALHLKGP